MYFSLTRSIFLRILPSLANSSVAHAFPLCVSFVISVFTGRLPQTFAQIFQTHSVTSTLYMLPGLCTSLVIQWTRLHTYLLVCYFSISFSVKIPAIYRQNLCNSLCSNFLFHMHNCTPAWELQCRQNMKDHKHFNHCIIYTYNRKSQYCPTSHASERNEIILSICLSTLPHHVPY